MAGGRRAGRGFPLRPVRPAIVRPHGGAPHVSGVTTIPLQWSVAVAATLETTSWVGDDDVQWQIPLEWACVLDLDPPDDVED